MVHLESGTDQWSLRSECARFKRRRTLVIWRRTFEPRPTRLYGVGGSSPLVGTGSNRQIISSCFRLTNRSIPAIRPHQHPSRKLKQLGVYQMSVDYLREQR